MPQLIAMALIGGVLWYGYRAFTKQMAKAAEELRKAEAEEKSKTELKLGKDGVYRPADHDD